MKSPLVIGTAVRLSLQAIKIVDMYTYSQLGSIDQDQAHVASLSDKHLLAFHQDPVFGRPAYPYKWGYNPDWTFGPAHPAEYWSGTSSKLGGTLVLMLNSEDTNQTRTAVWKEIS